MSTNATDIAEINVIGSILLNPGSFQLIDLRTEDFYFALHQNIFQTISDLSRNGEIIDPVTIQAKLEAKGQKIPAEILRSFASVTVTAANVEEYARIVKNSSLIRSLKSMSSEMQDVHDTDDGQEILVRTIKKLDELMQNGTPIDVIDSMSALLDLNEYRNAINEKPEGEFIRTRFENLDRILGGGLLKGGYYILAARTSMGKTSVALQIADNVAGYRENVLFVSLEMSVRQMTAKRISRLTGIPNMKILTGSLSTDEYRKFGDAASTLAEVPVVLNKRVSASVADVQAMAVRVNPCLIIIDYLGLIRPGSRRKSKYEEITEISHDLKALALKLNIPVLCLAQINRESEATKDKRPQLHNLRDSGDIEQDADGVMLMYRPGYYKREEAAPQWEADELEIIVAKNRHGNTGTAMFAWYGVSGKSIPRED